MLSVTLWLVSGCQHPIPVMGNFQGAANVAAQADVRGEMSIKLPTAIDSGPMVASVIRPARGSGLAPRLAVIDVDGVLLNQNREGVYDSARIRSRRSVRSSRPRPVTPGRGDRAADP